MIEILSILKFFWKKLFKFFKFILLSSFFCWREKMLRELENILWFRRSSFYFTKGVSDHFLFKKFFWEKLIVRRLKENFKNWNSSEPLSIKRIPKKINKKSSIEIEKSFWKLDWKKPFKFWRKFWFFIKSSFWR